MRPGYRNPGASVLDRLGVLQHPTALLPIGVIEIDRVGVPVMSQPDTGRRVVKAKIYSRNPRPMLWNRKGRATDVVFRYREHLP